jgi:hypothetical protein
MKRLSIFILLGLLFAAPGEILTRHNVRALGSTIISYAVLLFLGFFVGKMISARFRKSVSHPMKQACFVSGRNTICFC